MLIKVAIATIFLSIYIGLGLFAIETLRLCLIVGWDMLDTVFVMIVFPMYILYGFMIFVFVCDMFIEIDKTNKEGA